MLTLDAINFGSGWFPTLRKRPGCSGYYTVAWALADRFRERGPVVAGRAARARRRGAWPTCSARTRGHELMGLYAEALSDLGAFLGERTRARRRRGRGGLGRARWPSSSPPACRSSTTPASASAPRSSPNDLALAGVAEFDDLDRLTIFADNLVPHVLRVDGVLVYDATARRRGSTPASCSPPGERGARDPRLRGARLRADRRASWACRRGRSTRGCGTAARSRATRRCRGTGLGPSTTRPAGRSAGRMVRSRGHGTPKSIALSSTTLAVDLDLHRRPGSCRSR